MLGVLRKICTNFDGLRRYSITAITNGFEKANIVPEVITIPPKSVMGVSFRSGVVADIGNILTPTQVKDRPHIKYPARENCYSMILMVDPDAPSRQKPTQAEWLHWLVVNIRGSRIDTGTPLVQYVGAAPPKNTKFHRYCFLAFQQLQGFIQFDEPCIPSTSAKNRPKFKTKQFIKKYGLGEPVAGNYFWAQYDSYVDVINKQFRK